MIVTINTRSFPHTEARIVDLKVDYITSQVTSYKVQLLSRTEVITWVKPHELIGPRPAVYRQGTQVLVNTNALSEQFVFLGPSQKQEGFGKGKVYAVREPGTGWLSDRVGDNVSVEFVTQVGPVQRNFQAGLVVPENQMDWITNVIDINYVWIPGIKQKELL